MTPSGSSSFLAAYNLNNEISSVPGSPPPTYDATGNLLTITDSVGHSYRWSAYGNQIGIDSVTLLYDALGRMAEQQTPGATTEILYSPIGKIALMNGLTSELKAYVPLPGGEGAYYNQTTLHYRHSDWEGSVRFDSNTDRTKYGSTQPYAPYGEMYSGTSLTDPSFTGQNQDTASGLYDFLYREYSPVEGRWIMPDPAGRSGRPTDLEPLCVCHEWAFERCGSVGTL